MISALLSALKARSVSAVLLAVGLGVAYAPRDESDPEAIEAAAGRPLAGARAELRGFRIPAPDDYPLEFMPWIGSREDFIAHFTRGEDPGLVRRYSEGPEEELIRYLGEAFLRVSARCPGGIHAPPPGGPGRRPPRGLSSGADGLPRPARGAGNRVVPRPDGASWNAR
jgi:hypothetical protein